MKWMWKGMVRFFDGDVSAQKVDQKIVETGENEKIRWVQCVPFIALHLACLAVFFVGFSWVALVAALVMFRLRMFAVTGFYHRYFSHRTFKTSRFFHFLMGWIGCSAAQRGPLWWAAHHRHHHVHSDQESDIHSPRRRGFFWSHMAWFLSRRYYPTRYELVRDWARFPELRWLNRFDGIPPLVLGVATFLFGWGLGRIFPGLTSGWQMFVWAFCLSTICLYHTTYTINSVSHKLGKQRFETGDDSRNNWLLGVLAMGEGWHNNHHHYPASTRQGFYWWEIDMTYYTLKCLSWLGIVWDLQKVPHKVLERGRRKASRRRQKALAFDAS